MSNLTSTININIDKKTKEEATEVLNSLGLNMTTAINLFLNQVIKHDGIPFEIKNPKPTRKLKRALKEADKIASGKIQKKGYRNVDEMFRDILDED